MVSVAKNKVVKGEGLKILSPKQMLQRLPIALVQVKASNNSEITELEITEVIPVHCNIVKNDYQQDSRALYTFVRKCQLLEISPTNFIFLKTFNSEFSYIEPWFTDQKGQPLEIEYRTNLTLVIK